MTNLPEVELHIETTEIVAVPRKLRATWTYEPAQDLQAMLSDSVVQRMAEQIIADFLRRTDEMANEWFFGTETAGEQVERLAELVGRSPTPHTDIVETQQKIDWKNEGF